MALDFYLAPVLHDYIRDSMSLEIPPGQFYLQDLSDMVPRSALPTPFALETTTASPVDIWINGRLAKTHVPRGERDIISLSLAEPPAVNHIKVENGVDAPVSLTVTATYMTTIMDAMASQLYEVAERVNDKYFNLWTSPWATFVIEWLIPWQQALPDVRSLRSMSLKAAANTMFGEQGTDGGIRDMVSVFTSTTPVVVESANPTLWQPHTHQPYTSADDQLSWDFHVWLPNLCLQRWSALIDYVGNTDTYDFVRFNEDVVLVRQAGTEFYQQLLFDNTGPSCSMRGLLDAAGCMDRLTLAGAMELTAQPSFCVFANPFDMQVELPGIGGEFFDEDVTLDLASHNTPDVTNKLTTVDAFDQGSAVALATEIGTDYNAHDLDGAPTWHDAPGGAHQITAVVPIDLTTLRAFCIDTQTVFLAHQLDATLHSPADTIHVLSYIITVASTLAEVILFLNDFKVKYTKHQTSDHFDGLYDIDLLTDYWVGTSTSHRLDGGCLDVATDIPLLPKDQECCGEGPATNLLSTVCMDLADSASVKPLHPVYGGDDPGYLPDPYFGVLN